MAGSAVAKKTTSPTSKALATATAEVVTNAARNASGELVKGGRPIGDIAREVAPRLWKTSSAGPASSRRQGS